VKRLNAKAVPIYQNYLLRHRKSLRLRLVGSYSNAFKRRNSGGMAFAIDCLVVTLNVVGFALIGIIGFTAIASLLVWRQPGKPATR
jgi:hypothetical protein